MLKLRKIAAPQRPLLKSPSLRAFFLFALALFSLAALMPQAAFAQTGLSLTPVADAYVQDGTSANANFGAAAQLLAKNKASGPGRATYLRFDLSGVQGTITGAQLKLYGSNSTAGYSGTDSVSGVSDNTWTETGITSSNAPAPGSVIANATITSVKQYVTWDVSSYVSAAQGSSQTLVSFAVGANAVAAKADTYNSREAGSSLPVLVLTITPPSAPAQLTATAGVSLVSLSWPAVTGAVSYSLFRATTSGGPYTFVSSTTALTYSDANVVNNQTYYYVVAAANSGGNGPFSPEASATPMPPPPPAPDKVQITPGDTTLTITWNGVGGATYYRLYRSLSSNGEGSAPLADNLTTTSYKDTGLTNGVLYYYKVTAVNTGGEGAPSNEASAAPVISPPTTPTNVVAIPSNQSVSLYWSATPNATYYHVKRGYGSEGPFTTLATIFKNKFTDAGLTNGVPVYYVVSAGNSGGESDDSSDASATPGLTTFIVPSDDAYVRSGTYANTNYGADVQLLAKNSTGSANRATYLKFNLSQVPSGSGSIFLRLYGRNNGSGYSGSDTVYQIASAAWTESTLTYANVPALGAAITSTNITSTKQTYQWDVTQYVKGLIASGATAVSFAVKMDAPPANAQADIFSSKEGVNPPQLAFTLNPPGTPTGLTASVTPAQTQITLQWTAISGATSYNIKRSAATGGPYTTIGSAPSASYTDNSLTNGQAYYYVVSAVASGGESGNSNEASGVVPNVYPAADIADAYTQSGNTGTNYGTATTLLAKADNSTTRRIIYLKFNLAAITGPAASAVLRLYGHNQGSGYTGTATVYPVADTTWTETGLTAGNQPALGSALVSTSIAYTNQWYTWNVTQYVLQQMAAGKTVVSLAIQMDAVPANGQSDNFSSKEGANAPQLLVGVMPPAGPTGLTANAPAGLGVVNLTWTGSATATSYSVGRATTSGGPYTTIATPTSASYSDTQGVNGTTYYYVITALNAGGQSPLSNEASATPTLTALSGFAVLPNNIYGGATASATIRLNGPAPANGVTVTLSSNQTAAAIASSAFIASGQTSVSVPVSTTQVTGYTPVTLSATYNGATLYTSLTINPPPPPISVNVNFQPASSGGISGWNIDTGAAYSSARGYGWVRADSLQGALVPLDLTPNTRDRKQSGVSQQLNTVIHMQFPTSYSNTMGAITTPGAWVYNLPNGTYQVTVSVGDVFSTQTNSYDSLNTININGVNVINQWQGSTGQQYLQRTATAVVTNGQLVIDPNGGFNTKLDYVQFTNTGVSQLSTPSIATSNPTDGATGVDRGVGISLDPSLPNFSAGVDPATLTNANISLVRVSDGSVLQGTLSTDAVGSVIVFKPQVLLDPNTLYRFTLTSRVKDTAGAAFAPFSMQFTTGDGTRIPVDPSGQFSLTSAYSGDGATTLKIGPDHKLYAAFINGNIGRWTIDPSGNLTNPEVFTGFAGRTLIGMTFDPNNPNLLWIVNNDPVFPQPATDFTGRVSQLRLAGTGFTGTIQDYLVGLPRSAKDHMSSSLAFGPDGYLYMTQASNSSMGSPDSAWYNRPERLLNASVLRINPSYTSGLPINVQTEDYNGTPGSYNPTAAGAPVTLYATGFRNAYDLVWHSNGFLYCPTNGPSAGGNTPASPPGVSPAVPAIVNGPVEDDHLFKVLPGKYYGHPNPLRGQYVLNGGNPTAGADAGEVVSDGTHQGYPVGVQPDANYGGYTWDLGLHISADGVIEYKSGTFGGALQHRLLITEYSVGKDVVSIALDGSGNATAETQVASGFQSPLGITEDTASGNVYVADLIGGGMSGVIYLLRPNIATIAVSPSNLYFSQIINTGATAAKTVTITNTGQSPLTILAGGIQITGASAGQFGIAQAPSLPLTLAAGQSVPVTVNFSPTAPGPVTASLQIQSSDANHPTVSVGLNGLGIKGSGSANEPSLQWILTTLGFGLSDGDPDPTTSDMPDPAGPVGDEVTIPRFAKAGSGPVTITPLAIFGGTEPNSGLAVICGWYQAGTASSAQSLFSVPNASAQTLIPTTTGALSFDPGTVSFGMYSQWPNYNYRSFYQEDALNVISGAKLPPHHVRIFPAKMADGTTPPHQYVVTFEDSTNVAEFNDVVYLINNVRPATGHIAVQNLDGFPSDQRMVFNRIGTLANPPSTASVHNNATLRVKNTGADPLTVSSLQINGPWTFGSSVTLPATIAPGSYIDVPLTFVAESGRINTGSLVIQSDDAANPVVTEQLAGYWQSIPEGNPSQEPTWPECVQVFGYSTNILYPGQKLSNGGHVEAVGEEVLSPYWRQFDTSQPVVVRQMQAFHTVGKTATMRYFVQGDTTDLFKLFVQDPADAQSFLPRIQGLTGPAQASFSPNGIFGWKIDGEWSDPTLNTDPDTGAPPTGHHVRVWPARDPAGNYIPHTWLMVMDYGGGNFDYNDLTYIFSNAEPANPDLAANVNPLVGTDTANSSDNLGGTFPGAQTPFGMVQLSPDTPNPGGGGYSYQSQQILGFSHTHLSGPGGPAYGDISFMPTTGTVSSTDPAQYGSEFTHTQETASPGYYAVSLPTYGVNAELTATAHTGWHRYTFPATTSANILINTAGSLRGNATSSVTVVDSQTVEGSATSWGYWNTTTGFNPTPYTVYFTAHFSRPFTGGGTWDSSGLHPGAASATGAPAGAYVTFDTTGNPVVVAKVGLSFTSLAEARANLAAETSDFNFDSTRQNARAAWNSMLKRVEVGGGSPAQRQTFYTALYHTLMHPNVWSDVDGSYLGFDGAVHQNASQPDYANFSLWDTYRTEHPLLALIAPATAKDMMGSLMRIYREGGWLPHWSFGNVETNEIFGDPALPVLVDGYFKGILSDSATDVYNAAVQNATQVPPAGSQFQGRLDLSDYVSKGYVPYDPRATGNNVKLKYGSSIGLEYGVADGALSLLASALGFQADSVTFANRSHAYRSLYDSATGSLRPRLTDGTFLSPFDPTVSNVGFKEGNAAQYTWMVQQDPLGLAAQMGGAAAAAAKLDQFFGFPQLLTSPQTVTSTQWGQGGYYNPGNEPDIHTPYLYNYYQQPWKTEAAVNAAQSFFTTAPNGLPGNDDLGTMSAWYVLSALGLYPSMPGSPFYSLTTPLFPSAQMHLDPTYYAGQTLTINAPGVASANNFIQSVSLNGQAVSNTWLPHSAIQTAGQLNFTVGASPSAWGTGSGAAPPDVCP